MHGVYEIEIVTRPGGIIECKFSKDEIDLFAFRCDASGTVIMDALIMIVWKEKKRNTYVRTHTYEKILWIELLIQFQVPLTPPELEIK
jgi:hypothetical protein